MKTYRKLSEIMKLINENPELPILPMVYYDVVGGDDYRYWLGEWEGATIKEYIYAETFRAVREQSFSKTMMWKMFLTMFLNIATTGKK